MLEITRCILTWAVCGRGKYDDTIAMYDILQGSQNKIAQRYMLSGKVIR